MRHELDVITFNSKTKTTRKFGFIESAKAMDIFSATVAKFKQEHMKVLITLRAEIEDNYFVLVNSYLHDPKGSIKPKVSEGPKKQTLYS